ncbi:ricin B lectin domain-containing protein [Mycena capillaripes]|nr:ricin B lectin domain-containing protein [Mycena capillaripes]
MFLRNLASLLSVCSVSLYANAQLAGQTVKFQTILSAGEEDDGSLNERLILDVLPLMTGSCLTATSNADGAPVIIKNCGTNATALNSWVVPNGTGSVGTLQVFGDKCLDVTGGTNTDGTKLQIWTCAAGNTNQMWVPALGSLVWSGKDKCLDVTNGNITDGNQIQIWDCDSSNKNQLWNSIAVTTPKSFAISSKKNPALCVAASARAANATVVIEPCSPGSALQTWSDPTGRGNVMLGDNLCMSPAGSIGAGTKLVLAPCVAGNSAQEWNHETGVIDNFAVSDFAFVLDLTDGNETPGSQLQIWSGPIFNGTTSNLNQNWIVTNTF